MARAGMLPGYHAVPSITEDAKLLTLMEMVMASRVVVVMALHSTPWRPRIRETDRLSLRTLGGRTMEVSSRPSWRG